MCRRPAHPSTSGFLYPDAAHPWRPPPARCTAPAPSSPWLPHSEVVPGSPVNSGSPWIPTVGPFFVGFLLLRHPLIATKPATPPGTRARKYQPAHGPNVLRTIAPATGPQATLPERGLKTTSPLKKIPHLGHTARSCRCAGGCTGHLRGAPGWLHCPAFRCERRPTRTARLQRRGPAPGPISGAVAPPPPPPTSGRTPLLSVSPRRGAHFQASYTVWSPET